MTTVISANTAFSTDFIAASAVSETPFQVISAPVISRTPAAIAQGDWDAYYSQTAACHGSAELIENYGSVAEFKRHCARAYLGSNARLGGGRYSQTQPMVLTETFVKELRQSNQSRRDALHPTLADELRKLTPEKTFAVPGSRAQRMAADTLLKAAARKIAANLPLGTGMAIAD